MRRLLYSAFALLSATVVAGGVVWRLRPRRQTPISVQSSAIPQPLEPVEAAIPVPAAASQTQPNRHGYYGLSGLFFAAVGVLAAQTGALNPLLLFSWLMSIALVVHYSLSGNALLPMRSRVLPNTNMRGWESLAVVTFIAVAVILLTQTPTPTTMLPDRSADLEFAQTMLADHVPLAFNAEAGPLFRYLEAASITLTSADLRSLENVSRLFALLLIPAMYLLGRTVGSPQMGVFAAGFTAVAGWALALGSSGAVYSAIACFSAVYLLALYAALHGGLRASYVWVGILWGIGWLVSPWFQVMFWLLPLATVLFWLNERQHFWRTIRSVAAALVVMLVVIAPFGAAALRAMQPPPAAKPLLDPLLIFTDGLSSSLLMLAFQPILGVFFVIGLLRCVWRARYSGCWQYMLLPLALVIALVPSASSPNLQHAALALPVSMMLAAVGFAYLARLLTTRWKRAGTYGVIAAFIVTLIIVAVYTHQRLYQ